MAFCSKDKSGNMINTDILVTGYIRQDIESNINDTIPAELYLLCFEYWLHRVCDSWSNEFVDKDCIEINADEIKLNEHENPNRREGITLYGNHVAVNGSKHDWKIRMNKFGIKDSGAGFTKWMNPAVGIIVNNDETLKKFSSGNYESAAWAHVGKGYAFIGGAKYLYSKKTSSNIVDKYRDAGGAKFNEDGDIIEVHLDLINHTLGYTVNDEYFGIGFEEVEPGDYRLAISLSTYNAESRFQFLE